MKTQTLSQHPLEYVNHYNTLLAPVLADYHACNIECYYFAYGPENWGITNWKDLAEIKYAAAVVVWVAEDSLISDIEYNWYTDNKPHGLQGLEKICRQHPSIKFILVTEQYNLTKFLEVDNLHIVEATPLCWQYDRHKYSYQHLYDCKQPVEYNWVLLVNGPKWERIAAVSYLLSKNLDSVGGITIGDDTQLRCQQFEDIQNYLIYCYSESTWTGLNSGFQKLKKQQFNKLTIPKYNRSNNITNYNQSLSPLYTKTRLEIVCGSMFNEPTLFLTEKELQAFYASNFMILLNSPGTVSYLKTIGFDMFDDVVNHSYDQVLDPGLRVLQAIDDNYHLLVHPDKLDQTWKLCRLRFKKNCELADKIVNKLNVATIASLKNTLNNCLND